MTWIKICGITNLEDAQTAVDAGADALGFIFHEISSRRVDLEKVRDIVAALPPTVEKIGVFAFEDSEKAQQIAKQAGLTGLQIHLEPHPSGELRQASAECAAVNFYPAMPAAWFLGDGAVDPGLASFVEARPGRPFNTILLDSGTPEQPGGTGNTFDWTRTASVIENLSTGLNIIVAGGLGPGNVTEAIRILKPWGVDVSSGVEETPGKKDPHKVRAFVEAVRQADKKN
jgi:phosphoribosylanthranilate isomerase